MPNLVPVFSCFAIMANEPVPPQLLARIQLYKQQGSVTPGAECEQIRASRAELEISVCAGCHEGKRAGTKRSRSAQTGNLLQLLVTS